MAEVTQVTHPTGKTGKPLEVAPVGEPEPAKKTRKKRAPVIRIYEWIQPDGQLKPVLGLPNAQGLPSEPVEPGSTRNAQKWCNENLNKPEHNGKIYLVVPVQHRFTVKVEQQFKVTRE